MCNSPRNWLTKFKSDRSRCKVTAVVAVEPASAHASVLRKDAEMGQVGHACMASAETKRNSFSVVPLAA